MKIRMKFFLLMLAAILLLPVGVLQAAGLGNNIVVRLEGTAEGFVPTEKDHPLEYDILSQDNSVANVDTAVCFDLDIVDAKTGRVIGDATDCLSDIAGDPIAGTFLTGTTFFHLPGGLVVSQGTTTVQPILAGSPNFTHITGAIPDPSDNSVIYGDRKFQRTSGPVRLSGTVNLSNLAAGEITFDCIFILDLHRLKP